MGRKSCRDFPLFFSFRRSCNPFHFQFETISLCFLSLFLFGFPRHAPSYGQRRRALDALARRRRCVDGRGQQESAGAIGHQPARRRRRCRCSGRASRRRDNVRPSSVPGRGPGAPPRRPAAGGRGAPLLPLPPPVGARSGSRKRGWRKRGREGGGGRPSLFSSWLFFLLLAVAASLAAARGGSPSAETGEKEKLVFSFDPCRPERRDGAGSSEGEGGE